MDNEPQILLIVGRSETEERFRSQVERFLTDGFIIEGIHSLGEFYESDNKDRFIAFVACEDKEVFNASFEAILRKVRSNSFGGNEFDNIFDAVEYASKEYKFEIDDVAREEKYDELRERFPLFSAEEWEQYHIFDSLYHTGKVRPIRARFNDEPVVILAHITGGSDEVRVTPMMILITDGIHEDLDIPFM